MNYKSMKQKKSLSKIIGVCDCGFEKEFNPFKDLDKSDYHRFISPFTCPECGETYNTLEKNEKKIQKRTFKLNIFVISGLVGMVILTLIFGAIGFNKNDSDPTFLETGDPNDMTQKELEQYLEWKEKQKDKEFDNKKVYSND